MENNHTEIYEHIQRAVYSSSQYIPGKSKEEVVHDIYIEFVERGYDKKHDPEYKPAARSLGWYIKKFVR